MNLADIDINSLPERERHQMYPFWQAYHRPYPKSRTWRELRAEGYEPIDRTSVGLEEIEETFDEIAQWTIDEDGFVTPLKGDERASWLDRRINSWTRKREWKL